MAQNTYTPEFKAKIVLEVLQGERKLGEIAAKNNLNPNMVRNWKRNLWRMPAAFLQVLSELCANLVCETLENFV